VQFFYWLTLVVVISIAIFAVQNSSAPSVTMKFLVWRFETSLIYTIFGSIGAGVSLVLFFWIPRAIKGSIRTRELKRQIENLETVLYQPAAMGQDPPQSKEI